MAFLPALPGVAASPCVRCGTSVAVLAGFGSGRTLCAACQPFASDPDVAARLAVETREPLFAAETAGDALEAATAAPSPSEPDEPENEREQARHVDSPLDAFGTAADDAE
jgi:hypothetical protein